MTKDEFKGQLEEISYELQEFTANHTLKETPKSLDKLAGRLDDLIVFLDENNKFDGTEESDE